ncbi:MAG: hypothetical protein ACFHWX_08815 [Bacteroidota bacterium]
MTTSKGIILTLIASLLILFNVSAQKYGTTLGLRIANADNRMIGLTMQQKIADHVTLEGIIQSDFDRNSTTHLLAKRHIPLITKRLNIYTGIGVGLGIEESIMKDPVSKEVITTYGNKTLGTDLIIGAELTILGANVSLDYKPNINLVGRENWYTDQVGISIRTVLIKESKYQKNKKKKDRVKRKKQRIEARELDN